MTHAITVIGTLPPLVGLSPYTKELVHALSKNICVHFLGFRRLYPAFLFPGRLTDDTTIPLSENENLKIRNVLDWFNPFGWIIEAFKIETPVIHAQWWSYPLALIYIIILGINKLRGKKIIITVHNVKPHERNILKTFMNQCVFHLADEYIVHTDQNRTELQKSIKHKNIHIIPHGLITHPLENITKQSARNRLKIDQSEKILLCFGHIRDYKGLDTAIKALSLIREENVKLLIAGKCWEDWKKYNDLIARLHMENRIILIIDYIPTNEIEPIFRSSDLILLPYRHFEAQSGVGALILPYGIPMIVSNTGGLTDYVSDNNCIIEPNAHEELAQKITRILRDPNLYATLVQNIKEKKKELNWETIAEKTIGLYKTLTKDAPNQA